MSLFPPSARPQTAGTPHPTSSALPLHLSMSGQAFAVRWGPTCPQPHLRSYGANTPAPPTPPICATTPPPRPSAGFNRRAPSRRALRRLRFFCARVRRTRTALKTRSTTVWRGAVLCILLMKSRLAPHCRTAWSDNPPRPALGPIRAGGIKLLSEPTGAQFGCSCLRLL